MINTCEQYNNNYFYLKSLKNISLALKKEKSRDLNDLKFLLTCFKNEIGKSKKAIDNFNDKKQITIDREEESLFLIDKKLNDENIECISRIKFNQLKELDLSENEIVSIEPLCNLNLPFLEFLNLSHNKIKNINPLGEINLKKLKYLLIHNNEIIDINFLQESNFPKVEIVSIENNSINEKSDSFKELVKLYKKSKKLLVTNKEFGEIKKKYNFEYNENTKKIEIENKDGGDSMLKEIFIIIIHKNKNKIKELKLKGNKIEDPSILNRIQFNFLTKLDLSVNSIKNLNFLKQIKAKNLEELYLNNKDIIDISLLENIRNYFNRLEKIVLYENKIDPNEPKIKNLKSNLENKGVQLHLVSN
jgi:Leucine-rich repeat (LRR) protein